MLHRTKEDDEGASAVCGVRPSSPQKTNNASTGVESRGLSPESGLKHFLSLLIFL